MAHKLHYNHTYCIGSIRAVTEEGVDYFSMDPTATDKSWNKFNNYLIRWFNKTYQLPSMENLDIRFTETPNVLPGMLTP